MAHFLPSGGRFSRTQALGFVEQTMAEVRSSDLYVREAGSDLYVREAGSDLCGRVAVI